MWIRHCFSSLNEKARIYLGHHEALLLEIFDYIIALLIFCGISFVFICFQLHGIKSGGTLLELVLVWKYKCVVYSCAGGVSGAKVVFIGSILLFVLFIEKGRLLSAHKKSYNYKVLQNTVIYSAGYISSQANIRSHYC